LRKGKKPVPKDSDEEAVEMLSANSEKNEICGIFLKFLNKFYLL
jgi:hypothetical protein